MTDKNAAKANWLIAGACLVAMIWLAAIGYKDKSVHTQPPPQEYKNGEILYPDYAHDDTLTVIDADGLNQAATYCDGTDGEINEMLHLYCK
jgi:hypothetical protein